MNTLVEGTAETPAERAARHEIDRELQLVDSAIELVRAGAAVRVTLANLGHGGAIAEAARARASLRGLRLTEEWTTGAHTVALIVERAGG